MKFFSILESRTNVYLPEIGAFEEEWLARSFRKGILV
jgi:hypothetical protein